MFLDVFGLYLGRVRAAWLVGSSLISANGCRNRGSISLCWAAWVSNSGVCLGCLGSGATIEGPWPDLGPLGFGKYALEVRAEDRSHREEGLWDILVVNGNSWLTFLEYSH